MPPLRAYAHLLRLAAAFGAGLVLFVVLRSLLVPADYGLLGAYRAGALLENRQRPPIYAGQAACGECHGDVVEQRRTNAHAAVACESCHGPHARHAADPAVAAVRPDTRTLCVTCHRPDPAKPSTFKTVDAGEHAGDEACGTCHPPHAPRP